LVSIDYQSLKKGVFRVQPDDYGWQQDEYKLQNGQMDKLFVILTLLNKPKNRDQVDVY